MKAKASNRIVLRRIPMEARIGVYDWEQAAPQPVVLDIEFDLPDDQACRSDELGDTIDYAAVVARLRELALAQPHKLVEAMADTMCRTLHAEFGLMRLRLTLTKLAPIPGAEVGIVVERHWLPPAAAFTPSPHSLAQETA
jgi:dihydroneopterin aldolase